MRLRLLLSTTLAGCLSLGSALAQDGTALSVGEDPQLAESGVLPPEQVALLPAMDFRRWPDDAFFETKISLVEVMSASHSDERGAVMLDLAELFLSQMLTVEAESFAEAARDTGWALSPRYVALSDAVDLMKGVAVEDMATSPLFDADRPDRGLWLTLNGIASGDATTLQANLGGALVGLAYQSGPVARAMLPLITEAAVALENTQVSGAALSLIDTLPDLAETPTKYYLLGRHENNLGNNRSAIEAYFEAARGWDRYAARARIAIADLAIEEGSLGALLAARDVLSAGAGAWRGDHFEITTLQRQADVGTLLGESAQALLAYRRILIRFPESPEAEAAVEPAGDHLRTLYTQGVEGKIDLAEWFELHQLLLPTYRYFEKFPDYNELLADKVFEMGSTYLAIAEYRQILGIYKDWPSVLDQTPKREDLDRLHYKLARAMVRAHFWDDALAELDMIRDDSEPAFRDEINKLRLRALAELGESDTLLRTFVSDPDADSLRSWARALFARKDWDGAKRQYTRLFDTYPEAFRIGDASYLLIAAHRTNDDALGRRVAMAFPELTESEGLAGIASSLLEETAPLLPLRGDMTTGRLDSARDLVDNIERSGL